MLNKLNICNIALIKKLELEFCDMLNIMSGETGAGKSIIVDGLMLLLGGKYDKTILRYGEERGYVEGVFSINDKIKAQLSDFGIEDDDELIVTRRFNIDGKNEIKINGRNASISMLREIMSSMVDIYGQNEYQSLTRPQEHLKLLSFFVRKEATPILSELNAEYQKYIKLKREINELGSDNERARNIDMLRFQIAEITKAKIKSNEEEELISRRKIMIESERIASALNLVKDGILFSDDITASQIIKNVAKALFSIISLSPEYEELYNRLQSVSIELDDIAQTGAEFTDSLSFDSNDLERIEARLDVIRSLKRKYGSFEELTEFLSSSQKLLERLENSTEIYQNLLQDKKACVAKIYELSQKLSQIRQNGARKLEKLIEKELSELGMRDACFSVVFEKLPSLENCEPHISANGLDKAEFYLSANAGQPQKQLAKIISGGELSRFCLALKVVSSNLDDIPTLIFDEVDTGISGKIGQEVAKKLALISRTHQVLCVSHLPQIASMADKHFYIQKLTENGETITKVTDLNDEGIIDEISRLSGAKDISTKSTQNAIEMKNWSIKFKTELK